MPSAGIQSSLKERGVRLTRQRRILLDLLDRSGRHLNAEALYQLAVQKDPKLKVVSMPGLNIAYWSFNTQKPPFDKKEVRQALTMAIDKAAILKDVYMGAGTAAVNFIPPTMAAFNSAVKDHPYDPAKAKALLAKAGVKTPLDIDLWYMPVQRPYNPNAKRMAEIIQADLDKAPAEFSAAVRRWTQRPAGLLEMEQEIFGENHCQIGAHVARQLNIHAWYLPAIANHHTPQPDDEQVSTVVATAAAYCAWQGMDLFPKQMIAPTAFSGGPCHASAA